MKKDIVFYILIVCAAIFTGCRQNDFDVGSEEKLVKAVIDNYAKSWITEDMDLYDSTMSSDESLVHIGGSQGLNWIQGWTELEEIIIGQNKSFNETNISETRAWINISQSSSFAWAVTLWDLTTTLSDGTKCLIPLRCTWILEKQNGKWYIVHFHKSIGIKSVRDLMVTE
ncbi:MAG: hypothetical protein AMS27_16265 [Bacteroides sp. SM23_62_1]|nr:MAG: hypothetical protein AMS27_16265 [Bacteroides sp. SM23_62_1]